MSNLLLKRATARNLGSGFTLIELLIVVAVIAILAAIAIPFYEGQKVKAKLVEVEHVLLILKSAVSNYHQQMNLWPDCPTVNEVRNSLGLGVDALSRISAISISNGIITVTIQNIHPLVDHKSLSLIPTLDADGSIGWSWGWSTDFPLHLRPKGS